MQLYKFYEDCGRMGSLDGLFASDQDSIDIIIGRTVHFGEVLGKHSDVSVKLAQKNFRKLDIPEDMVRLLVKEIGDTTISGFNPFSYLDEDEDEGEDDDIDDSGVDHP